MIEKLVSGGQTGADIAALDVALRYNFPHGEWCPKGRLSLDGQIPAKYQLKETPSAGYRQRTEWNVRDSNGTTYYLARQNDRDRRTHMYEVAKIRNFRSLLTMITNQSCITLQTRSVGL